MILLYSTGTEKTRASIHLNDKDDCRSLENNQSDNDKDLNAEGK